ncbi:MAG: hypothetical protein ACK5JT_06495 [Hyphomicrobiaceae bacterium]
MTDIALRMPSGAAGATDKPAIPHGIKAGFVRIGTFFMDAQRRRVEREVARYLALNGGIISDDVERKLVKTFMC